MSTDWKVGGSIPIPSYSLSVKVSMGKILNPESPSMHPGVCVWVIRSVRIIVESPLRVQTELNDFI